MVRLTGMVMAFCGILGYSEIKRKMNVANQAPSRQEKGEDGVPLVAVTPKSDR